MIEQRLRQARVFTVGIGASPNSFLLRKAAEVGRGNSPPLTTGPASAPPWSACSRSSNRRC
ncbi:hypothetical protein ULG90_12740 [Halopseudomonas pachastrellae]|nr:hypothetical protein ULG90_12740 [Halopseudomonas pachastrellae]